MTTFVKESPPRNNSNFVNTRSFLMLSNWGWGGMEFLMVVLSQSTGLEDGSRPLQTSERPLLGWEMVIFRGAEKFGTWPLLTPNLTFKAQYARVRTPKLIPSTHPLTGHGFGSLQTSKRPLLGWETSIFWRVENFGSIASDFYRVRYAALCARARTQKNFHNFFHDLRLVLGFYRSQKGGKIPDLQAFKVA